MKIPPKIRITSRISYEVLYSDLIKDDSDCLGFCCPEKRQITLKKRQSDRSMVKSLIHETIHAIEFEIGVPIPHKITYALEEGIFKLLTLNGWI